MKYMTVAAAKKVYGVVGDVISQSEQKLYDGGLFIRVKVIVDVTMPLCRGRLFSLSDNRQVWVSFRYERLPNLCYWCASLLHDDRDCERWIESEGTLKADQREFGPELRAQPFVASKKSVVSVPGYYATRRKEQRGKVCQPMEETTPVQPYPESTTMPEGAEEDHDHYKSGGNQNSLCNGNSDLNPIKTADPIITPVMNSINYGIPEESTNVETLPAMVSYATEVPGKEKEDEVILGLREGINC